jgi:hypothetical protein
MKRLVPVLGALIVLHAAPARADWTYTKWGMTPEQVASASKGEATLMAKREKIEDAHIETAVQGTHTDGALKLRTAFQFDTRSGGLRCVLYAPQDSAQDELLKQALTKQYGQPKVSGMPAMGYQTLVWNPPTEEIFMTVQDKKIAGVSHCKV